MNVLVHKNGQQLGPFSTEEIRHKLNLGRFRLRITHGMKASPTGFHLKHCDCFRRPYIGDFNFNASNRAHT